MKYGLDDAVVARIQAVLASHPKIEQAILYGSRAKGNYRPGSDIDLTLIGAQLSIEDQAAIAADLDDLLLPYTIDLSILARLTHAALHDHIKRVGITFYVRSTASVPASGSAPVHSANRR